MSQEMEVARYNIYKAKRDLDTFAEETKKVQRNLRRSKRLTTEVVEDLITDSMVMVESLAKRYHEMAELKEIEA